MATFTLLTKKPFSNKIYKTILDTDKIIAMINDGAGYWVRRIRGRNFRFFHYDPRNEYDPFEYECGNCTMRGHCNDCSIYEKAKIQESCGSLTAEYFKSHTALNYDYIEFIDKYFTAIQDDDFGIWFVPNEPSKNLPDEYKYNSLFYNFYKNKRNIDLFKL